MPVRKSIATVSLSGTLPEKLAAAAAAGIATSHEVTRALLQTPGGMALRENDPLGVADATATGRAISR